MLTPNGGVFGRNPTFNTVTTQGTITCGATAVFAGNVTLTDGNVVVASAKGIDFSATANGGGTMTSELLSDYEEGTWTPTYVPATGAFTTMTMTNETCTYTKIGRVVHVQGHIRTASVDATGASGSLRLSGLPFTIGIRGAGIIGIVSDFAGDMPSSIATVNGETLLRLNYRTAANTATIAAEVSDLTTGASSNKNQLYFSAVYTT